jgi:hypothetical protein
MVNLSAQAVRVTLPQVKTAEFMDVTSLELASRYTLVEGQLAETLPWQQPSQLPWQSFEQWRPLPAHSYRWALVPNVHQCGDSTGSSI